MPKHLFFDLDDTLTPSRTRMRDVHVPLFERLCLERDVIVVSGAQEKQMRAQLPISKYFMLTQNGNHAIDPDSNPLWSEKFTVEQVAAIERFIGIIKTELQLRVRDENDLVENRGSQISYSLIGHNSPLEEKRAFDPGAHKRLEILARHTAEVRQLIAAGIEVTAGGTTCLDIYLLGRNKGFNVARLMELKKWSQADSVYVGDALEPGRNDESVLGVIPTRSVTGPEETFEFIAQVIS